MRRSRSKSSQTSVILEALIADLNDASKNDRIFDSFQVVSGRRISAVVRGKVYVGEANIDLNRGIAHFILGRRNCESIVMDVPLARTPAVSPAAQAFNRLFRTQ